MAACPHCGGANGVGLAYCEHCGKALPGVSSGPRLVEGATVATTATGRQLQSDELGKKARTAAGALLAVAILSTLGVFLVWAQVQEAIGDPEVGGLAVTMIAAQAVMAGAYWGLWFWARSNPLPAAIIGLAIFLALMAVNAIAVGPETLIQGILIKAIIIVVLVKAIQAGVQHRAVLRDSVDAL